MIAARKKHTGCRTRPCGPHLAIPAEERALDVKEAIEKGSSAENGPSAVATFVDGFVLYYPVELTFAGPQSPNGQPSPAFS